MSKLLFHNPYTFEALSLEPKWKGTIRGYFVAISYWKGHYLYSFLTLGAFEELDLPIKEL